MDIKHVDEEKTTPNPPSGILATPDAIHPSSLSTSSDEKATVSTAENIQSHKEGHNDITKPYDPALAPRYTKKEEDAVIRKLDWHLMPLIFVLYSLSVLDRSNLGNARISGMEDDIDLTGKRYDWLGTAFYISCKYNSTCSFRSLVTTLAFFSLSATRPCVAARPVLDQGGEHFSFSRRFVAHNSSLARHSLPMDANGLESLPAPPLGRLCRLWLGHRLDVASSVHILGRRDGVSSVSRHLRSRVWPRRPSLSVVLLPSREARPTHGHLPVWISSGQCIRIRAGVRYLAGQSEYRPLADLVYRRGRANVHSRPGGVVLVA